MKKNGQLPIKLDKIIWCKKQKRGIKLVKVNDNLSDQYMNEANNTLESLQNVTGKWKIIMAYYTCYNALYSILMKAGAECEIHDCSIAIMGLIEEFSSNDISFISDLKKDRIDVQYYLKEKELTDVGKVKDFLLKCKAVRESLDAEAITQKIKGDKN